MKTDEPQPKFLGDTPQKRFEKILKKKASEDKQTRGQQTLVSGCCTSKRLFEFEPENEGV